MGHIIFTVMMFLQYTCTMCLVLIFFKSTLPKHSVIQ